MYDKGHDAGIIHTHSRTIEPSDSTAKDAYPVRKRGAEA